MEIGSALAILGSASVTKPMLERLPGAVARCMPSRSHRPCHNRARRHRQPRSPAVTAGHWATPSNQHTSFTAGCSSCRHGHRRLGGLW
jgi:hypothetical protein